MSVQPVGYVDDQDQDEFTKVKGKLHAPIWKNPENTHTSGSSQDCDVCFENRNKTQLFSLSLCSEDAVWSPLSPHTHTRTHSPAQSRKVVLWTSA